LERVIVDETGKKSEPKRVVITKELNNNAPTVGDQG